MKQAKQLLLIFTVGLFCVSGIGQSHGTGFVPATHGFHFPNSFDNRVQLPGGLDIRTGGLCGGMVYAAMDHYLARRSMPQQDYLPAEGTPLQRYLYDREYTSLLSNADKWTEISFNPGGARDSEFFNWGLQATKGGRLEELRSFLDRGMPVPLGLKADKGGDHQVLAIGYDMGRYHGDLGVNQGDLKIFIYDPNYPRQQMTLVPDLAKKVYVLAEDRNAHAWRTYFVDKNYHTQVPPDLTTPGYPSDGLAHELVLTFGTGTDDLRGGNDNVSVTMNMLDGSSPQVYRSINHGARWMSNTTMSARVVLTRPVSVSQIHNLVLSTSFSGGAGGDNWDMTSVSVRALGGNVDQVITSSNHYHRFTDNDQEWTLSVNAPPVSSGQVQRLRFEIRTGGDDLRGNKDNLNIEIHFADGRTQMAPNVNNSSHWANNTSSSVDVVLDRAVPPEQITRVSLVTHFGGGTGGDNWNMDSVKITAIGPSLTRVIGTYGFNRFTGDRGRLEVPTH
jgi:hypothetical protein